MATLIYNQWSAHSGSIQFQFTMLEKRSPLSDLYFHLSQVLQNEIWCHNQTRSHLVTELANRLTLEEELRKVKEDVEQWRKTCRNVYESLNDHRAEATRLREELQEVTTELERTKVRIHPQLGIEYY